MDVSFTVQVEFNNWMFMFSQSLMAEVEESTEKYDEAKDSNIEIDTGGVKDEAPEWFLKAGQSKRIWNELYKVHDCTVFM